jgi:phosphomannomutase
MDALMIGVSGLRGTVGGSLTPGVVMRMAAAFAAWLNSTQQPRNGSTFRVVLARDSRPSGPWVRDAAAAALVASGIEVVDLDIVTTPGAAMMVSHLPADAAIIVTASHNPIQWNGLKLLNREAVAPPPQDVAQIRELFDREQTDYAAVEQVVPLVRNSQTHALHLKRVLDYVDVLGVSTRRYKVVLDSVNGAGCVVTHTLLSKLGCQIVHLNGSPDGRFAHEPEPTEANLQGLCAEVRRQHAHIGLAQDPDADRLAIVDETGRYIGEEYSLALCARYVLGRKPGVTVANLSTSRMLDDVAAATGSRVVRSAVGEANVIQAMKAHGAVIGGEGNGGVIDTRIVGGRDSLVGIAHVLSLMAATGKSVSQLVDEIPRYTIIKTKFPCRREDAVRAAGAIGRAFPGESVDTQDGVRIDWHEQRSWVHARPSNTEPIMRIIAEAPTAEQAQQRIDQVRQVVDDALASAGA